ncbi:hypothetical protein EDB80DRAFT_777913 [Ilyonectria destructans]|nr:hypothetical protein EDB80DRAFT_777913 [Ilyonectria destructans]
MPPKAPCPLPRFEREEPLPPIIIRHPHYSEAENVLLSFPPVDHLTDKDETDSESNVGLHYGTVLSACQIILGNDKSAYLSYDQEGETPVELSYDGFLTYLWYYLQTPRCMNSAIPYAVIAEFENWEFQDSTAPGPWFDKPFEWATSTYGDQLKPTIPRGSCVLTGASTKDGVQTIPLTGETTSNVAHLIPLSCSSWFQRNGMSRFSLDPCSMAGPDSLNNICHLRSDLLTDFNRCKFVFAPRRTSSGYIYVAHYLSVADDLSYPAKAFHNQMVRPFLGVSEKYIYARFAFSVFQLLRHFVTQRPRRLGTRERATGQFGIDRLVTKISIRQMGTFSEDNERSNPRKRTICDVESEAAGPVEPSVDEPPASGQEQTVALQSLPNTDPSISRQIPTEENSGLSQRFKKRWVLRQTPRGALQSQAKPRPSTPERTVTGLYSGIPDAAQEQRAIEQGQSRVHQVVPTSQSATPGPVVTGQRTFASEMTPEQRAMQQQVMPTPTPGQVATTKHDATPRRETPRPTGLASFSLDGMPAETRPRLRESEPRTMARTQTHTPGASAPPQLYFPYPSRPASTR